MENQGSPTKNLIFRRALYIYLGVCVLLVLIILASSFKQGSGTLQGELYLRPNITLNGGN